MPRDRSSRLRWRGSSRDPLATAARDRDVALDSPTPGLTLWVLDGRLPPLLLLENNLLVRLYCCSLGSMDDPGLLLDATALLDALPVREDVRGLSVVLSTVLSPDRSVLCICGDEPFMVVRFMARIKGLHTVRQSSISLLFWNGELDLRSPLMTSIQFPVVWLHGCRSDSEKR